MTEENWFMRNLKMDNTEQVKPGFFIQKRRNKYRRVYPLVWDNKLLIKEQLKTVFTFRTFATIAIILFIAWSYQHDVQSYQEFYEKVRGDPLAFCAEVKTANNVECTAQWEAAGLCIRSNPSGSLSLENIEVVNGKDT